MHGGAYAHASKSSQETVRRPQACSELVHSGFTGHLVGSHELRSTGSGVDSIAACFACFRKEKAWFEKRENDSCN